MNQQVENLLTSILKCKDNSSGRLKTRSFDEKDQLVKLARKKSARSCVLDSLKEIVEKGWENLRRSASYDLGQLLTSADSEWTPYLKKGLRDDDRCGGATHGLLNIAGDEFYPEIVKAICDRKIDPRARFESLSALCEHSGQDFDEDLPEFYRISADDFPVEKLKAWAKGGYSEAAPIQIPEKQLDQLGVSLPPEYCSFLQKMGRENELEFDDELWEFTPADQLFSRIKIDGQSVTHLQRLKAYAKTLRKVLPSGETQDARGKAYSLKRLKEGLAIATSDSGDVLFLDPTDNDSICVFFPDGGDVEKLSKSFRAWRRRARKA